MSSFLFQFISFVNFLDFYAAKNTNHFIDFFIAVMKKKTLNASFKFLKFYKNGSTDKVNDGNFFP